MSDTTGRGKKGKLVRDVGLTLATPVLAISLCPVEKKRDHAEVPVYPATNPVGGFAINAMVSSTSDSSVPWDGTSFTFVRVPK